MNSTRSSDSSHNTVSTEKRVKLPKLNIEPFNGDVEKYQAFKDSFDASVHNNPELENVEKFLYLRSYLSEDAAEAIAGFSTTNINYIKALEVIEETFGRKDLIINAHVSKLINMDRYERNDNKSLRKIYNNITTHVRALEALEVTSDAYSIFLVPIVLSKLNHSMNVLWAKKKQEKNIHQLLTFMKNEVESLENALQVKETFNKKNESEKPEWKERKNSYRQYKNTKPTAAALYTSTSKYCTLCKDNNTHETAECRRLKNLPVEERRKIFRQDYLCFSCLKRNHLIKDCHYLEKLRCEVCDSKKHHTLLHIDRNDSSSATVVKIQTTTRTVLFQTATAYLIGADGKKVTVRMVLDGASDRSYIRSSLSKKLNMTYHKENICISSFQGRTEGRNNHTVRHAVIENIRHPKQWVKVELIETEKICNPIIRGVLSPHILQCKYLEGLQLAEDYTVENENEIDILIGLDFYWNIVSGRIRRNQNNPVAIETMLGWILQGRVNPSNTHQYSTSMFISTTEEKELTSEVKKFWELEAIGILPEEKSMWTIDEEIAYKKFNESITYNKNKYQVGLPWRGEKTLADNKEVAFKRLKSLEARFKINFELKRKYHSAMNDYINNGFAELIKDEEINNSKGNRYYLPHHAVVKEDRISTQVRIVFNGSSQEGDNESLNEKLYSGPALQPLLNKILIRFRTYRIGLTADIQKMYLNIKINPEDRDSLRFLWKPENSTKVCHYRNTVIPFGVNSSPFLAIATIHHHLSTCKDDDPTALEEIRNSMYVDDLITGTNTIDEAKKLYQNCNNILKKAGMILTKWHSNQVELSEYFNDEEVKFQARKEASDKRSPLQSEDHIKKDITKINTQVITLTNKETVNLSDKSVKILGVHWCSQNDIFTFKVENIISQATERRATRRNILSIASKLYDPLGLISPYIVQFKILQQSLWNTGLQWDEIIPKELNDLWCQWWNDMPNATKIKINRRYSQSNLEIENRQLHVFADASEKAIAAVAYLRIEDIEGNISVQLVYSKTKVCPIQTVTIPRLELIAAVLAARIGKYIVDALDDRDLDCIYWTDSNITLHWIRSTSKKYKQYVANRVYDIHKLTDPGEWKKCSGKENPADIPSRGMSLEKLKDNQLWWVGPSWLSKKEEEWPVQTVISLSNEENSKTETRKYLCMVNLIQNKVSCIDPQRYSKMKSLLQVICYVKRFIYNTRNPRNKKSGILSIEEMQDAHYYWLRETQEEYFREDIENLKQGKPLSNNSKLKLLNPMYDTDHKLIRLTGRIQHSELPEDHKHPIILPDKSYTVELIIKDVHESQGHVGVNQTLATLRSKFWILKGRRQVKNVVLTCLVCRKYKPKPLTTIRAPLPKDRVVRGHPFQSVGIDFTGPLYIEGKKYYICLYTCSIVRAVHLELVCNLSTPVFLQSFRRFISRRGLCHTIYTDNAGTFKKANKDISQILELYTSKKFKQYLTQHNIKWKYIVERAPWWGGFYERLMKSIKLPLKKILGNSSLNVDELTTVLTEVEAIVNSRPLTYISDDTSSLDYITPASFLIGRPLVNLPLYSKEISNLRSSKKILAERINLQANYLELIWKKWHTEYLSYLGITNPACKGHELVKNQLVSILDHSIPRQKWKVGIIQELIVGKDNKVRAVKVRTSGGILTRTIQHISLLETEDHISNSESVVKKKSSLRNTFDKLICLNATQEETNFDLTKFASFDGL